MAFVQNKLTQGTSARARPRQPFAENRCGNATKPGSKSQNRKMHGVRTCSAVWKRTKMHEKAIKNKRKTTTKQCELHLGVSVAGAAFRGHNSAAKHHKNKANNAKKGCLDHSPKQTKHQGASSEQKTAPQTCTWQENAGRYRQFRHLTGIPKMYNVQQANSMCQASMWTKR